MSENKSQEMANGMTIFGWIIIVLGAALIFFLGVMGTNIGRYNIANIPSVIIGGSMLVTGAVFVAAGYVAEAIKAFRVELRANIGVPLDKLPKPKEEVISGTNRVGVAVKRTVWTFLGQSYPNKEKADAAAEEYRKLYGRA